MFSIQQVSSKLYSFFCSPGIPLLIMAQLDAYKFLKRYIQEGGLCWPEREEHQDDTMLCLFDGEVWVATIVLYMELCAGQGDNMRNVSHEVANLERVAV